MKFHTNAILVLLC